VSYIEIQTDNEHYFLNEDLNRHGVSITTYDCSSNVYKTVEFFDNGVRNGKCIQYTREGSLVRIRNYAYGCIDGLSKEYYVNGSLSSVRKYKNSSYHGMTKIYDSCGNLGLIVVYDEGRKNGTLLRFYDGMLFEKTAYVNDVQHGVKAVYGLHSSFLRTKCHVRNGFWHGEFISYSTERVSPNSVLYINGKVFKMPETEEEKLLLALTYDVQFF
jgi:antitoxin component YwqK of YwqJK toxin-antitoxin module